jgi:hypothetical protein
MIVLFGGTTNTNTWTFSAPVIKPILAIFNLGGSGTPASFNFTGSEPFTIESGGPSAEFGGSALIGGLDSVSAEEGNGTVEFNGTFSSISWTNPKYEFFYGFTAGITEAAPALQPRYRSRPRCSCSAPACSGALSVAFGSRGGSLRLCCKIAGAVFKRAACSGAALARRGGGTFQVRGFSCRPMICTVSGARCPIVRA